MSRYTRRQRIKEMKSEYRAAATKANRRMTQLEKLAQNPDYKAVLNYAYGNVQYDLNALGMTGGRFTHDIEKLPANKVDIRHLMALINAANQFLEAPSSTKKGIDKTYKRRAHTLNRKYKTKLSPDDMRLFFESSQWEKLINRFDSGLAMRIVAQMQKTKKEILDSILKARQQHKRMDFSAFENIEGLDLSDIRSNRDKGIIADLIELYREKG